MRSDEGRGGEGKGRVEREQRPPSRHVLHSLTRQEPFPIERRFFERARIGPPAIVFTVFSEDLFH